MRRKHQQLLAWKDSIGLVKLVYRLTHEFSQTETYGLVSQMRRAAVSVPSNIAEGAGRTTRKEFLHYLSMARGSLTELDTHIVIARELGYLKPDERLDEFVGKLFGLIGSLINSVRRKDVG